MLPRHHKYKTKIISKNFLKLNRKLELPHEVLHWTCLRLDAPKLAVSPNSHRCIPQMCGDQGHTQTFTQSAAADKDRPLNQASLPDF